MGIKLAEEKNGQKDKKWVPVAFQALVFLIPAARIFLSSLN